MKLAIEDIKGCNILVKRERLNTVSQRGVDEMKSVLILPYPIELCEWNPYLTLSPTCYPTYLPYGE